MASINSSCTVGKYTVPKESQTPYLDYRVVDRAGSSYSFSGGEGAQNPMIELTAYATGTNADSVCETISLQAKEIMLSRHFRCIYGPTEVTNATNTDIKRWIARYKRDVCSGDTV